MKVILVRISVENVSRTVYDLDPDEFTAFVVTCHGKPGLRVEPYAEVT